MLKPCHLEKQEGAGTRACSSSGYHPAQNLGTQVPLQDWQAVPAASRTPLC